jgi:type VI secretion system protein ImpA
VNTAVSQVQNAAPPSPAQVPAAPVAEPLPQMAQPGPVTPARSSEPESEADALHRIEAGISYIGAQSPESPLPFALRSAMRLAELRQIVLRSEMERLEAPPTELRQSLKRALAEGDWRRLHQASLAAMGQPCGCGWLDLYRYLWTSCRELGWQAQQFSIAAALQQCLREFPELPGWSLNDDTPAANHETAAWIAAEINPPVSKPESPADSAEPFLESSVPSQPETASVAEDAFAAARAMAARGDIHGAIQSLAADAAQQTIGRLRYQRNLQIAALCVEHAKCTVAVPLLQGLVREVEDRRLESWESVDLAARPYALLLQCGSAAKVDTASVFARLCSIDPGAALTIAPGLRD